MAIKAFFRRLGKELIDDSVPDVGAMLAYYAVLALFPMIVFVLSVSLLVIDAATIRNGVGMALEAVPPGVRDLIGSHVDALPRNAMGKLQKHLLVHPPA